MYVVIMDKNSFPLKIWYKLHAFWNGNILDFSTKIESNRHILEVVYLIKLTDKLCPGLLFCLILLTFLPRFKKKHHCFATLWNSRKTLTTFNRRKIVLKYTDVSNWNAVLMPTECISLVDFMNGVTLSTKYWVRGNAERIILYLCPAHCCRYRWLYWPTMREQWNMRGSRQWLQMSMRGRI